MRGTPGYNEAGADTTEIIPAYAGNTFAVGPPSSPARDHPRVCGEHIHLRLSRRWMEGSSPRMRGTPCILLTFLCRIGIIPAYAGNTTRPSLTTVSPRDHPRVCGEHRTESRQGQRNQGSSPRMRGTPRFPTTAAVGRGIIPAYAGNTSLPRPYSTRSRDHPRVCGEHATSCLMASMSAGSSPRMRGTPGRHALHWRSVGIIPAYAGNTST